VAFDAEMVVAIHGQMAFAASALENALRDGDAGWNLVFFHLLHRHLGILRNIIADILLVVLRKNLNATQ
jgi:hypothetical protein